MDEALAKTISCGVIALAVSVGMIVTKQPVCLWGLVVMAFIW